MWIDRYPLGLNTEVDPRRAAEADQVIYRLAFTRLAVAGMPDFLTIGKVEVHFVVGPIRTQITESRQRAGLPFVFDKRMRRGVEVGHSELLTVCELLTSPVPADLGSSATEWREHAEGAIGLLCAITDERLARAEIAEDMVLLRRGDAIAAADFHARVRTHMPFDVTTEDREALEGLAEQELSMGSDAARAAGLYHRATREGPTPHGLMLMWLAVDAIVATEKRYNQKREVGSALSKIGFDLGWLNLDLGSLVGLRGGVAHGKVRDPRALRLGYYDTEAIARALIRQKAGIQRGWPAMPSASAFRLPFGRQIAEQEGRWADIWHDDCLPLPDDHPDPSGVERFDAVLGGHEQWIRIVGVEDDEQQAQLRFWAMAAVRALDVEIGDLAIAVDTGGELAAGADIATNQERILVAPGFAAPDDEAQVVRLAFNLCHFLASMQVMRVGVVSDGIGALLIDLAGAWAAYREWVVAAQMPSEFLQRGQVSDDDLQGLGAHLGVALAGDAQAAEDIRVWLADETGDQDLRDLARRITSELEGAEHFADVLGVIEEIADAVRELQGDPPH